MDRIATILVLAVFAAGCTHPGPGSSEPTDEAGPTTGALRGFVESRSGERLASATVTILTAHGAAQTTGANGYFSFADLPPGEHTLRGTLEGYHAAEYQFPVVADQRNPPMRFVVLDPVR